LPLIAPIRVTGLTVGEAEAKIVRAYTQDKEILLEGNEKIIVTLMQRRTYNVLVIREDGGATNNSSRGLNRNEIFLDEALTTESFSIELPNYENDVLHALSETGGMPGESARNEILILRGAMNGGQNPNAIVQAVGQTRNNRSQTLEGANVVRIPIRGETGSFPQLSEDDITLEDGDVVFIKGRQRDVFYTGGLQVVRSVHLQAQVVTVHSAALATFCLRHKLPCCESVDVSKLRSTLTCDTHWLSLASE